MESFSKCSVSLFHPVIMNFKEVYIIRRNEKGQYACSLKIDFVQDKQRKLICKIHSHYFRAMSQSYKKFSL